MLVCRLWTWQSSAKTRKKGGRRGLRPWPLRCLSQFLSERKERLLRWRMCCVCLRMSLRMSLRMNLRMSLRTFHRRGGHVFIVDVQPVG